MTHVWKNEIYKTDTVSTPSFLGLDGSSGVWNKQFGGSAHAGEGVIVGVLDTGFWPESPSFAPLPEPRPDAATIAAKWHGTCDPGSDPNVANRVTCNNKVIGARWYDAGGLSASVPDEFLSPRDRNSHGSHTASTTAGDQANAVSTASTSAPPRAWRRQPASPSTRSAGSSRTAQQAGSPPISLRPSMTPPPMAST